METLIEVLNNKKIAVVRTDTIYGILGTALHPHTVERIYEVKQRDSDKPCIILISEIQQLSMFGVEVTHELTQTLLHYWPGPVSIILPVTQNAQKYSYLHRGTHSLAFRMPQHQYISDIITQTGPLVAPSANPQGEAPARTIAEAHTYFGDSVDYYDDGGEVVQVHASTVIKITSDGNVETIRP